MNNETKQTANFLMSGNISIKSLYEAAKEEGFENAQVFFAVEEIDGTKHSHDVTLNELFRYWKTNNELVSVKLNVIPKVDDWTEEEWDSLERTVASSTFSENIDTEDVVITSTQESKTIQEIADSSDCPLPLEVIPNYMGINLSSVKNISWTRREDGQLVNLTIDFIPANN